MSHHMPKKELRKVRSNCSNGYNKVGVERDESPYAKEETKYLTLNLSYDSKFD